MDASPPPTPRPSVASLALALVVGVVISFGLFRVGISDIPEHLMVGRWIWTHGAPMTTNEVSWTFPDAANPQQYPMYQVLTYLLVDNVGWWTVSVVCCVLWTAAFLAWMAAAGPWRALAPHSWLWLIAALGVQRHLVARPEVVTVLGMGLLLVCWERWRAQRGRGPLLAMVLIQWVMVNNHQMWVLGLALQVGFALHLLVTRLLAGRGWVDDTDASLPIAPVLATALASTAICALSPQGVRVYLAPLALLGTMEQLGASSELGFQSAELAPIWTDPIGWPVTLALVAAAAVAAWRVRGRWHLYELGVLAIGAVLVFAALRGIPFFAVAAALVLTRWAIRSAPLFPETSPVYVAARASVIAIATMLITMNIVPHEPVYLQRQHGLGRSVGEWGEEATSFLRRAPPPGEMMNIGWVAANYLNYDLYPVKRVFVDGRWEAYPREFIDRTLRMTRDPELLQEVIEEWQPGFVLAEMRKIDQQERVAELVAGGDWKLVYVDSIVVVVALQDDTAPSRAYLQRHGLDPAQIEPGDWLPQHPILYAQQQIRVARLLAMLGERQRADALVEQARAQEEHPAVLADLATYPKP